MRFLPVLAVAAMLAGCVNPTDTRTTTSPTTSTGSPPVAMSQNFDASTSLPSGWQSDSGTWTVTPNNSAPSKPNVLRGTGAGGRSTLKATSPYRNFNATVKFLMVNGDEGAGLSFRYQANGDYRIIRYSVREAGWHYFIMEGGQADKRNEATIAQTVSAPTYNQWVTLRIEVAGKHVRAWDNQTLVIDFTDPDEAASGAVGPFLRGSATALFDDLTVKPLP